MSGSIERAALALCEQALKIPQPERDAWVQKNCGDDLTLLHRVQRLLEHIQPTEFKPLISPLVGEDSDPTDAPEPPPGNLGAYRIVELIGRGGMGAVYKAERADGAFERIVAIKLVGAIRARSDAERRFTNERQILARMRHRNIAQLLDGGTLDGRGYLVMEYVEGEPFKHDAKRPLNATLTGFIKVCEAVQYAHNSLVLHRDIKPDNVLLDETGEPKLLDFGIAKLDQELSEPSAAEESDAKGALLTLNYSAPERLLGEPATVSTEVYSLGIYLFVLLHGVRPYDLSGKTLPQAWQHLRERTHSTAATTFGDIGLIAEKAMHSDIDGRYTSVAELAADVKRFQNRETVTARPANLRYSLNRFVARNKAAVIVSSLGLLLLIGAFITTSFAYIESQQQAAIARQEATTASQAVEFLRNILSTANPMVSNQNDMSVTQVLEIAKERLGNGDIDNPSARAYIESALALAHYERGEFEIAIDYSTAAVDRLDQQGIKNKNQRNALYTKALALVHGDKPEPAVAELDRFMAEAQAANDTQSWSMVEAETLLGHAQENLANEEAAGLSYRSALTRAEQLPKQNLQAKIVLLNNYGRLLQKKGDLPGAMRHYQQSLDLTKQVENSGVRQAVLMANIAGIHGDQQRWPEAITTLESALALQAQADNLSSPHALISRTTLANFQRQSGDLESAEATIGEALTAVTESLPEDHFITAYVQNVAAVTFCNTDRWQSGLDYAKRSLATRTKIMPPEHWVLASGKSVLGKCETRAGNYPEARRLLTEALEALIELRGEDGVQTRLTRERLGALDVLAR